MREITLDKKKEAQIAPRLFEKHYRVPLTKLYMDVRFTQVNTIITNSTQFIPTIPIKTISAF